MNDKCGLSYTFGLGPGLSKDTIKTLGDKINLPITFHHAWLQDGALDTLDSIFFVNPKFDHAESDVVLRYISQGGSAYICYAGDMPDYRQATIWLQSLGVRITKKKKKRLKLEYGADYPNKHRISDVLLSAQRKGFSFFSPSDKYLSSPLITTKIMFREHVFCLGLRLGNGMLVLANSFSIADDRADLVRMLLLHGKKHRDECLRESEDLYVHFMIDLVFKYSTIYDPLPIAALQRRFSEEFDNAPNFMKILESAILDHQIAYLISGEYLIPREDAGREQVVIQ
jgi:hypothetical protein